MTAVGVSIPRRDSETKVRGITRFAGDLPVPGLLHARLVLSYEAHARIAGDPNRGGRGAPGRGRGFHRP
jgi:CO/xanthine dehydrogenase Mo-binding subunit